MRVSISLVAAAYSFHLSRLRQSSGVILKFLKGEDVYKRQAHGLAAGLFDLAGDGVGAGLVQVGDGDGRAGARQGQRAFLANAAGGAGDDGDFYVQIAHAGDPPGKDAAGRGAPADARGMA